MVCCSMTAPLTASYRSGDISRHLLPSQKQTRMENSGRIIGSAYSMRQPVKISQHVKFGNRALPYFHRNRLIQMAAEVDEVPGEGFGRRGKKRRRREAQDNEDRAKTSDEMIAENPFFYDYKKDDMEGGGWNVLGFFLENSVAVFAVAFLITAGLAAYFFQVTGGMEFGL